MTLDVGPPDRCHVFATWENVVSELKKDYGDGAKVAVFPYSSIQCPPFPEDY